jgi:tryptophan synthase beta chain
VKKIIFLDQSELPTKFYNILPDLPAGMEPPLDPETKKPINPAKLERLFPKKLVEQEMSMESEIPIPAEVLKYYAGYRPSPLIRATNLEKFL